MTGADGAFAAAISNDQTEEAGRATTQALVREYLHQLGWSEERMAAVGFEPETS